MLEIDSLRVAYGGVVALDGVSLNVPERAIVAVLGPNGAGKSTLLRTVAGLVRPTAGRVTYRGKSLLGLAPEDVVRMGISLVPEGGGVIRELTVDENLRLAAMWRGGGGGELREVYELFPALAVRRDRPSKLRFEVLIAYCPGSS